MCFCVCVCEIVLMLLALITQLSGIYYSGDLDWMRTRVLVVTKVLVKRPAIGSLTVNCFKSFLDPSRFTSFDNPFWDFFMVANLS